MYGRILIALEGRQGDLPLVEHVARLAARTGAQVTLLRIVAVADDGGGGLGKQFQLEVGSSGWRRKNEAEADLTGWTRRLQKAGLPVETALVVGTRSEGDEIVAYAAEHGFDLIAMACDPRPWWRRLLRGAQDDDVLRKATVPTLFVGDGHRAAPAAQKAPQLNLVMAILGSAEL